MRLLKHACGARHPGVLQGDIFQEVGEAQSARFTFSDAAEIKEAQWSAGPVPDLEGVDIYDTTGGLLYVDEESEVTFEPWLLRLFTRLTASCSRLSELINNRIGGLASKKPDLPPEWANTDAGAWYQGISAATSSNSVDDETVWTPGHEAELGDLNKRLVEVNPAAKAESLRRRKRSLLGLKNELQVCLDRLMNEPCEEYIDSKADAAAKRKAAAEDAKKVFESSPLGGVGSESWLFLWEAARKYSEEVYAGVPFPDVSEDARCVLCQQILDKESRSRFISFEDFVKGELKRLSSEADQKVREMEALFPVVPTSDVLNTKIDAAGIEDPTIRDKVNNFVSALTSRWRTCLAAEKKEEISPGPPSPDVLVLLEGLAEGIEKEAIACEEDAKGQNRPEIERRAKELAARKWLNQQRNAINEEITRLTAVAILREMDRLTNTYALSVRKGNLAEELITNAYVSRFREELKELQGSHIKIELKRSKAIAGHVYHKIALISAKKKVKTSAILSEGEFRIVSLAAFLADAEGRGARTPFIFDDPISSLDLDYENATARRLVKLSALRQVIVFTHRLSLLGFLEKYAEKEHVKPRVVCLSDYKIGDIGELPINLKKTSSAVNDLLHGHLKKIQRAYTGGGEYEKEAGAICLNIRILLERVVEQDLINDVVRRFNPEVQTKGKIQALAMVTEEDCKFIDEYMTKYSRYEHSQPDEAPIKLPRPEEIEEDLNAIAGFIKKIKERNKNS